MTDVAGVGSAVAAAGWQGVQAARGQQPCLRAYLVTSTHPSDYRTNLQAAADQHSDLVIAASFLLGDAVLDVAAANPGTRFVLVDPLMSTSGPANLAVITFREEEAGFLAGALAGLTTRSGVIAGVYGLEDDHNQRYRGGFERGARYVNSVIRVMGAYQGAQDGSPYANPQWGAAQARAFLDQGADVVFTTGDLTGRGALTAAADAGKSCVTVALAPDPSPPACLSATMLLHVDRAVAGIITDAAAGLWRGGDHSFGLAAGAMELRLSSSSPPASSPQVRSDVEQRLEVIARSLTDGTLSPDA